MAIHTGVIARESAAPRSWFALAIPATIAYLVVGSLLWSVSGQGWLGAAVMLALAAATAFVARQRTSAGLIAYLSGTAATLLGLYAAIAVAGELWLRALGA